MNIVLIGSCTDSSNLAKELNKRLNNSIIARVDLLKNIKQLVLQGMESRVTENLGAYVGDVEVYDYSKIAEPRKAEVIASFAAINSMVKGLTKGSTYRSAGGASTFDALTSSLPTGTYSFIKVYSGAIDDERLNTLIRNSSFLSGSVFITIKNPKDLMLPISVSEAMKKTLKEEAFAFIESNNVDDVFNSEVFQLLFELNKDKEPKAKAEPVKEEPTNVTLTVAAHMDGEPVIADPVVLHMMAA